jgi:hypothetical protein
MIYGAHFLLYSQDPEADRAFFRDVLQFRSVELGQGWLIFALPPAELAVHPGELAQTHASQSILGCVLYLMCTDLEATVQVLAGKGVSYSEIEQAPWGVKTTVRLPSGGAIGLYQPTHETAI